MYPNTTTNCCCTSTVRTPGHDPCQESNRCACSRFRSEWRVPTIHPESIRTSVLAHYALLEMLDVSNLCVVAEHRLCGLVVRVSGYRYRGPGFDPRRYQLFWVVSGLERGPLSLVRSNWGATWIKKSSGSRFRKQRLTAVGTRCANHVTPL